MFFSPSCPELNKNKSMTKTGEPSDSISTLSLQNSEPLEELQMPPNQSSIITNNTELLATDS